MFLKKAQRDPSLVLILKWGGELTSMGRVQAEELGKIFRSNIYPHTINHGAHEHTVSASHGVPFGNNCHSMIVPNQDAFSTIY